MWKTNAPPDVVYDIFKSYKLHVGEEEDYMKGVTESSRAYKILSRPIQHKPNFKPEQVKMIIKG